VAAAAAAHRAGNFVNSTLCDFVKLNSSLEFMRAPIRPIPGAIPILARACAGVVAVVSDAAKIHWPGRWCTAIDFNHAQP